MPALRSIAMVGTYPPTRCGIATFTASLARAVMTAHPACRVGIVACATDGPETRYAPEVVRALVPGSEKSLRRAAAALSEFDTVVVQHEFGIFGGDDGREVLPLLEQVTSPCIVVLHTVPRAATPGQRAVLEGILALSGAVVVQGAAARARLLEQFAASDARIETIPHGARWNIGPRERRGHDPVVLTWGLLSRDKGIEWGIEAVAALRDLRPRYVVMGQTHPRVRAVEGEVYRDRLRALADSLGVSELVEFDDGYRDTASLLERVRDADVVLLPYRSDEQVVSGVLVEAIASGKPVVATQFPHAEELLGEGSGLVVPHGDPAAMADALRLLLTDAAFAESAGAVARRQAQLLTWERVGARYVELASSLAHRLFPRSRAALPEPSFAHLRRLTDTVGVIEHARFLEPRREGGYCTDDCARALVVLLREPELAAPLERVAATCLRFLERAQVADGRFHNRLSAQRRWEDDIGSDDATGRALLAAATAAVHGRSAAQRARGLSLFERGSRFDSPSPRANANATLAAAELLAAQPSPEARALCRRAAARLGRMPSPAAAWRWPERRLAYANAVLAEARIAGGEALHDERLVAEGLSLLAWLVRVEWRDDHFSFTPVGGWAAGEPRPGFDQQPIEAEAMAAACARAYDVTGEVAWRRRGLAAVRWFLGENDVGTPLLDAGTGGCRDGLTPTGANQNEGAESTIVLLSALQLARRLQAAATSASTTSRVRMEAAPTQRSAAPYVR